MGTVCDGYWTSGRSRQQPARKAVRTTKPTHRRKVLHIGDDGVRVRRHSSILLQLRVEGTQPEQERYRSTTPGMDRAEGHFVQQLHQKHPVLSTTQPCSYQLDHQNQEGALSCVECHPFQYDELLHSISA